MSVTYTAALPVRDQTVEFLAGLLAAERVRRGTRNDTRSLSCHAQAVLALRWFLDGTRLRQLARDNAISKSTAYDYLHEAIDALAAQAPSLHGALLAAKTAGYSHVIIDGTLVETDRVAEPGPTLGVDLWWSGKHGCHGGNVLEPDVTSASHRIADHVALYPERLCRLFVGFEAQRLVELRQPLYIGAPVIGRRQLYGYPGAVGPGAQLAHDATGATPTGAQRQQLTNGDMFSACQQLELHAMRSPAHSIRSARIRSRVRRGNRPQVRQLQGR